MQELFPYFMNLSSSLVMLHIANVSDLREGPAKSCLFKTALHFHLHFPHLVSVVTWLYN